MAATTASTAVLVANNAKSTKPSALNLAASNPSRPAAHQQQQPQQQPQQPSTKPNSEQQRTLSQQPLERTSLMLGNNVTRALHPHIDQIASTLASRNPNERKVPYYSPADVAQHNRLDSLWLSALGVVYDLTPFVQKTVGFVDESYWTPLFEYAGRDVSHWFDTSSGDLRMRKDPITNLMVALCPDGRFVGTTDDRTPTTAFDMDYWQPWWRMRELMIGLLTSKSREIYVFNMLTAQEKKVEVCSEDTIRDVANRVRDWNAHIDSYTWKYLASNLNMDETLDRNGIPDEENTFFDLGIEGDHWVPRLMLYFNDDLTEQLEYYNTLRNPIPHA